MSFITISICLSDIPKDRIKQAANGKCYFNMICASRREKGKFDETHTVYISSSQQEREAGAPKIYVGSGKELTPQNDHVTPEAIEEMTPIGNYAELPF